MTPRQGSDKILERGRLLAHSVLETREEIIDRFVAFSISSCSAADAKGQISGPLLAVMNLKFSAKGSWQN